MYRRDSPNNIIGYLEHLRVVFPSSPEEYPRRKSEAKKEDHNFQDVRVEEEKGKLKENEDMDGKNESHHNDPRSRTTSETNRAENEEDTENKDESDKAALVEVVQQLYMMFK